MPTQTKEERLVRELALLRRAMKDPTFGWPVIRGGRA